MTSVDGFDRDGKWTLPNTSERNSPMTIRITVSSQLANPISGGVGTILPEKSGVNKGNHPQISAWTPKAVETLRRMGPTHSASQIAAHLGVSRNMVIGKMRRMGIAIRSGARGEPSAIPAPLPPELPPNPIQQAPLTIQQAPLPTISPVAENPKKLLSLFKLTSATCRWPVGDPRVKGFGFCGDKIEPLTVYCACHRAMSRPRRVEA